PAQHRNLHPFPTRRSSDLETDDGNSNAGHGNEVIAEDALAREASHNFANHSHGRQNHDVNGGMRVEPEQVLEQDGITPARRIEEDRKSTRLNSSHDQISYA